MLTFYMLTAISAGALLVTAPAFGQAPARVRGTIANLVPSSIDAIKVNDFVGTAVKGPLSAMVAVELAQIPANMRAGRIAFYDWDPLPYPVASPTSGITAAGADGSASGGSPRELSLTNTSMTNGIVSAENKSADGLTLMVNHDGGGNGFRITVPPNAPIVRYILSDRTAAIVGSAVMIKTSPGDRADLVTIGKGVTPPM
jgi:hypothetical protein